MRPHHIAFAAAMTLLGACAVPTEPTSANDPTVVASARAIGESNAARRDGSSDNCTFSRGITTCVSTVEYEETTTRQVFSGCLYGPNAVPGRRITTFSDRYLVTATTTTSSHGRSGRVFDSSTTTTRVLLSSTQISTTCEPI